MKSHLKVKLYTLTTEMTYIRRQEEKWKNKAKAARAKQATERLSYAEQNFWSQRGHRTDLKTVARTTHLAYGAMKGIPYSEMEYISYGAWSLFEPESAERALYKGYNTEAPDWKTIAETVERFSKDEPDKIQIMQRFGEWLSDAKNWFEGNPERIAAFNSVEAKAARAEQAAGQKAARKRPAVYREITV